MPINEESKKRKNEFLDELSKVGIDLQEVPYKRGTIYHVKNLKVYLRTTTKENRAYWYDLPKSTLSDVDYLIFQTTSKSHFTLFPVSFFRQYYELLKPSNRKGAKIFYIEWNEEKLYSGNIEINIKEFCCSIENSVLPPYGNYSILI